MFHVRRVITAGVLALTGCGLIHLARLPVPPEVAQQTTPLAVKGLSFNLPGTNVRFGGFEAHDIGGRYLSSRGIEIANVGLKSTSQELVFQFKSEAPGQDTEVGCSQGMNSTSLEGKQSSLTLSGAYSMSCDLKSAGGASSLTFAASPDGVMTGQLTEPNVAVDVTETHEIEGSGLPAATRTGIYFKQSGHIIAAVDTMNGAQVWLPQSLGEPLRTLIAASAAALLIQSDLRENH